MFKFFLLIPLLTLILNANVYAIPNEECDFISQYAGEVMAERQSGAKAIDLMSNLEALEVNKDTKTILLYSILKAFETKKYTTPSYKKDAVKRFKESFYIYCMKY
jgi:hypothetical protein